MHRAGGKQGLDAPGPGAGSVSPAAVADGRAHGITVLDGGCPCMFDKTADVGHKVMRPMLTMAKHVPRRVWSLVDPGGEPPPSGFGHGPPMSDDVKKLVDLPDDHPIGMLTTFGP